MKKLIIILVSVFIVQEMYGQATIDLAGSWSTGASWDGDVVPTLGTGDDIDTKSTGGGDKFQSGQTSTVDGDYIVGNITFKDQILQISSGNSLTLGSQTLFDAMTFKDFTAANNTTINVDATGTLTIFGDLVVTNNLSLNISGSLIVKGNISMSNGGTLVVSGDVSIEGDFNGGNNSTIDTSGGGTVGVDGDISFGGGMSSIPGDGSVTAGTCTCSGCTGGCPTVVPIDLKYFGAVSLTNAIELTWITASEENNDYFTLERSSNGLNFNELTRVSGAGNSFEILNYSYQDKNPFQGVSYYRLKQTDYDGTNETFKVVAAEFYGNTSVIKVMQTLGGGNELLIHNNLDEENIAYIYDMTGRGGMIGSLKVGENYIDLNQINAQSGMYTLRVVNVLGKTLATQKFVIQ